VRSEAEPDPAAVSVTLDREQCCDARVLINAAGAWAETLARSVEPAIPVPRVERVHVYGVGP